MAINNAANEDTLPLFENDHSFSSASNSPEKRALGGLRQPFGIINFASLDCSLTVPSDAGTVEPQHSASTLCNAAADASITRNIDRVANLRPDQKNWIIQVKVTRKNGVMHYSDYFGQGNFFNVDLIDKSGEIRGTGYNEECDRLFSTFRVGNVYYITGGIIKRNSGNGNESALTFSTATIVERCFDSDVFSVTDNQVGCSTKRRFFSGGIRQSRSAVGVQSAISTSVFDFQATDSDESSRDCSFHVPKPSFEHVPCLPLNDSERHTGGGKILTASKERGRESKQMDPYDKI